MFSVQRTHIFCVPKNQFVPIALTCCDLDIFFLHSFHSFLMNTVLWCFWSLLVGISNVFFTHILPSLSNSNVYFSLYSYIHYALWKLNESNDMYIIIQNKVSFTLIIVPLCFISFSLKSRKKNPSAIKHLLEQGALSPRIKNDLNKGCFWQDKTETRLSL